jgi:prepilin-type processing-associated H-X9-DG protein
MNDPNAPRLSRAALASFVLGLASLFLLLLAGLPALALGLRGLRDVHASDGRLRGRRLAAAGMLLGGLGCLATLAGLAVGVVAHLTVRSQRLECANNLRRIGLAANKYADAHQEALPRGTLPGPQPPEKCLSWLAALLPYLGEQPTAHQRYLGLSAKLDPKQPWDAPANAEALDTPLSVFLCRAHPHFEPRPHPGLTHYVGLTGVGPDAARLPTDSPRAGVFGYDRVVRRQDVTAGISFTMLATETAVDNGPWLAGGRPTLRELAPDETHYIGPGRPFGGLHPGGANVLWVDASVRWVGEGVSPEDFRAQATLSGKPEPPAGK